MKHHECPNDFDPTRSYRDGVIQDVPSRFIVEHHGNVYVYCYNEKVDRMQWANCHPAARHLNGGFGVRWWMDGHEVTALGMLLIDAEDRINNATALEIAPGRARLTFTIDFNPNETDGESLANHFKNKLHELAMREAIISLVHCIYKVKEYV